MALAYEGNTDLTFDTGALRRCGKDYLKVAQDLEGMAARLDSLLTQLSDSGWTTPAGKEFQKMAETNWEENIKRYADLLKTLDSILNEASMYYDNLEDSYIETTKLGA